MSNCVENNSNQMMTNLHNDNIYQEQVKRRCTRHDLMDSSISTENIVNDVGNQDYYPEIKYNNSEIINDFRIEKPNKRDANWEMQYNALILYSHKHGHCNVRTGFTVETEEKSNINLYAWLALQRRHKKQGKLREDREKKLQRLVDRGLLTWSGSDISSKPDDDKYLASSALPPPPTWDSHFDALLFFCDDHGHGNVPIGYTVTMEKGKNVDLGAWMNKQRKLFSHNQLTDQQRFKLSVLTNEYVSDWNNNVEPITFSFSEELLNTIWDTKFREVVNFIQIHGHCNIDTLATNYLEYDVTSRFDVGLWLLCQRKKYAADKLRADRLMKLQALVDAGQFVWISPMEAAKLEEERIKKEKDEEELWMAWYNVLVWHGKYKGHCNVDSHATVTLPDGSEAELGKWLSRQRSAIKHWRLPLHRLEKLKALIYNQKLDASWMVLINSKYGDSHITNSNNENTDDDKLQNGMKEYSNYLAQQEQQLQQQLHQQQQQQSQQLNQHPCSLAASPIIPAEVDNLFPQSSPSSMQLTLGAAPGVETMTSTESISSSPPVIDTAILAAVVAAPEEAVAINADEDESSYSLLPAPQEVREESIETFIIKSESIKSECTSSF